MGLELCHDHPLSPIMFLMFVNMISWLTGGGEAVHFLGTSDYHSVFMQMMSFYWYASLSSLTDIIQAKSKKKKRRLKLSI